MHHHGTFHFKTDPVVLQALADGIVAYAAPKDEHGRGKVVWLQLVSGEYVRIVTHDATFGDRFEIFSLKLDSDLPDASCPVFLPWPIGKGSVEVLMRTDWSQDPPAAEATLARLDPGEVPDGAKEAMCVADALLFTDEVGNEIVIAADDLPTHLMVSAAHSEISRLLRFSTRMPLGEYVRELRSRF